ncbi:MAG TPA: branched-chain amino acid ABC transporter permease [Thermodesulfobacteriota bacterium]|nr:branched-chain amino acid ABC transporter permease [Thermodesulfobacteriota bacterium]
MKKMAGKHWVIAGAVLGPLIVLPFALSKAQLHLTVIIEIHAILAVSLGLVVGFVGQLSLCHAGLYGIGAYTSALLTFAHWPFWLALPTAGAVSGIIGLLIGLPSLKTRGIYFSITTLSFGVLMAMVLNNWISLTEGPDGLSGIVSPEAISLFGWGTLSFKNPTSYYFLVGLFLLFTIWIIRRLLRSRVGRAFISVRDNETLAGSLGIDSMRYKLTAFTVAAVFAGFAGSLYAHYLRYICPKDFGFAESFDLLVMVVVGGAQTILGPIIGAMFILALPKFFGYEPVYGRVAFGIILIVVMIFMPQGIMGKFQKLLESSPGRTDGHP